MSKNTYSEAYTYKAILCLLSFVVAPLLMIRTYNSQCPWNSRSTTKLHTLDTMLGATTNEHDLLTSIT